MAVTTDEYGAQVVVTPGELTISLGVVTPASMPGVRAIVRNAHLTPEEAGQLIRDLKMAIYQATHDDKGRPR